MRPSGGILARLAAAAALACAAAAGVAAQGAPPLVVGWAELDPEGIPEGLAHAATLIPRLLMEGTSFADSRLPGPGEAAASGPGRAPDSPEAARAAVAAARRKADLVAITVDDPFRRESELAAARKAVADARDRLLAALASVDGGAHDGAGGVPAAGTAAMVPWQGHADGLLLEPVSDPAAACRDKKLDILVFGSVRDASGYLAVELSVYVASTGTMAWTGVEYAFPDDLPAAVAALTRPVATALLGRPYSLVELAVTPAHAALRLDGEAAAAGRSLHFGESDPELLASAPGFSPRTAVLSVRPGRDVSLRLELEPVPAPALLLESDPPGATVHVDGLRAGVTPLELGGAAFTRVARLTMPGRVGVDLVIPPSAGSLETVTLPPADGLDFSGRFEAGKDRFYRSLGWFVLSLPVSVLSYGSFSAYRSVLSSLAASGSPDPAVVARLEPRYYATQAVFWASAAASAALAVNAVIELAGYIGAAE